MLNLFEKPTQSSCYSEKEHQEDEDEDEDEDEEQCSDFEVAGEDQDDEEFISIVVDYIINLSMTCDFPELPYVQRIQDPWQFYFLPKSQTVDSFKQELKDIFVVPRLNSFHQTENLINKFQLLEAFLSLLLQILYHRTDPIVDPFEDGIENLEEELRFFLTILGDISWMFSDSDEPEAEFQNLLPEFEALANQVGSIIYYLFFTADRGFERMGEDLAAVLNQIDLFKANFQSSTSISAYTTPRTSVLESMLILNSVVDDLQDLLKREDDPIPDVKDQVSLLYHELLLSHSSIHEMRLLQPSEIEELKEPLVLSGGIAHQVEYLITAFLVKDAPLWYAINRLTDLSRRIEPIRKELQLITLKYQFGGLEVADEPLQDKRNTEINDVTVGFEDKTTEILYQLVGRATQSLQIISILGMPGLDELFRCFLDNENGSRILLTSRNKDVAPHNSKKHELPFFTDEECWELLEKVFRSRTCPPQLQGIGKEIAARCCGLPLTVVATAGVLSTIKEDKSTWEEVGESLSSYTDNAVMQILELSYKNLPDYLKPCFLYFGRFEEDEEISIGKLKRFWVAEGFIRKEKDKSAEDIAGEYLMELVNKSLVMIAKRRPDWRGVKSCVVHDLLRVLCLKISKEERFLEYPNNYLHTIYEKGHRIRAFGSRTLSHGQHVRSFVGDHQSSSFYVRDMRLLRVLPFNIDHAFGIEFLVNLRFLVIHNLPTWIDLLVNLEYVRVEEVETYLPPAIMNMKKLRYIRAISAEYGEDWNSDQTNNLEYLSGVSITKVKDEDLLKCSPHLRILKCRYYLGGSDERECPHFDFRFLTQLVLLTLFGYLRYDFGFPSNIRKLTLCGSYLAWQTMSILGRLEFLEILKLKGRAYEGERWDTRDGEFQKLMFLKLEEIHLSEWNVASNEHFPKLQQLFLIACRHLKKILSKIGEITTLELIQWWGLLKE